LAAHRTASIQQDPNQVIWQILTVCSPKSPNFSRKISEISQWILLQSLKSGYFDQIQSFHGLGRPSLESYSAIINGHARLGNLDSAAKWFGDMERNGLTATRPRKTRVKLAEMGIYDGFNQRKIKADTKRSAPTPTSFGQPDSMSLQ
jgi:pentatricopeptide repeat protein